MSLQTTISPHNQQPLVSRSYPAQNELDVLITKAREAQKTWSNLPLKERVAIGYRFMVGANISIWSHCIHAVYRKSSKKCLAKSPKNSPLRWVGTHPLISHLWWDVKLVNADRYLKLQARSAERSKEQIICFQSRNRSLRMYHCKIRITLVSGGTLSVSPLVLCW